MFGHASLMRYLQRCGNVQRMRRYTSNREREDNTGTVKAMVNAIVKVLLISRHAVIVQRCLKVQLMRRYIQLGERAIPRR